MTKQPDGPKEASLILQPNPNAGGQQMTPDSTRALTTMMDRGIELTTWAQLMEFAEVASRSALVPESYRGKAPDIAIAIQWGKEVGLSPMQALTNIAVIRGRATVWGDAVPGLCFASGLCEYIQMPDPKTVAQEEKAEVVVKRVNMPPVTGYFDKEMAQKAGLWNKEGTWKQYPHIMLINRARAFACRWAFADVLKGLHIKEEIEDLPDEPRAPRDITPRRRGKNTNAPTQPALTAPSGDGDDTPPTLVDTGNGEGDETNGAAGDNGGELKKKEEPKPAAPKAGAPPTTDAYQRPIAPREPTPACQTRIELRGQPIYTGGVSTVTLAKVLVAVEKFDTKEYAGAAMDALGNLSAMGNLPDAPDWFHLNEEQAKTFHKYLNENMSAGT